MLLRAPFAVAEFLYNGNLVMLITEKLNDISIHLWNSDSSVSDVSFHSVILVLRLSLPLISGAEWLILHNSDIG